MEFEPISTPWRTLALERVATVQMGQAPPGDAYNAEGAGWPLIAGASDLGEVTPAPSRWTERAARVCETGDIIVCVRATIGDLNWADKQYCLGRGVAGVRARSELVIPEFLAYWLAASKPYLLSRGRGSTFHQISRNDLASLGVPVPDMATQREVVTRIREALARVDEVRRLRTETAREADAVEAALVADLLASLPDDVVEVPLGQVLIRSQYGTSQKASLTGAGVPVYRMGNIQRGRLLHDEMRYVELPAAEVQKYALQPGDILINRTNSLELVGKAACVGDVPPGAVFASYLVRLIVDRQRALPEFVSFVINSRIGRDYVLRTARRAIGMVNINTEEIGKMPVPLPPLTIQEAMVAKFIEVRQACDALRSELSGDQVDALPSAILRKAFAGELLT